MGAPADATSIFAGGTPRIINTRSGTVLASGTSAPLPALDLTATGWNAQSGDKLLIYIFQNSAAAPGTPTDSASGTWATVTGTAHSTTSAGEVAFVRTVTAAALVTNFVITLTTASGAGAGYVVLLMRDYVEIETTVFAVGNSAGPALASTTPTVDQTLVLAFCGASAATTFSATPAGYASWESASGNGVAVNLSYVRQGTATATAPAWTLGVSARWTVMGISVRVSVPWVAVSSNGAAGTQVASTDLAPFADAVTMIGIAHKAGTLPTTVVFNDGTTNYNATLLYSATTGGSTLRLGVYYLVHPNANTLTVATTGLTAAWSMLMFGMRDVDLATFTDALTSNTATATGTTVSVGPTSSTTKPKVDFMVWVGVTSSSVLTPAAGYVSSRNNATANGTVAMEHRPLFATATPTVTATLGTTGDWVAIAIPVRFSAATQSVADGVALTDAATAQGAYARSLAQDITVADAVAAQSAHTRSLAENISVTDAVTGTPASSGPIVRTVGDTASATDAVSRTLAAARATSDTASATDAVNRVYGAGRAASEAIGTTDAAIRISAATRTLGDAATATDATTRTYAAHRATSDSATTSDAVARFLTSIRTAADSSTATDAVSRVYTPQRTASDTASAIDTMVRHVNTARSLGESIATTDAVARTRALSRAVTEYFSSVQGAVAALGEDLGNPSGLSAADLFATRTAIYGKTPAMHYVVMNWQTTGGAYQYLFGNTQIGATLQFMVENGTTPMLNWQASAGAPTNLSQPNFSWTAITSGTHDAYITDMAKQLKAFGATVVIRLMDEMNTGAYCWGVNVNGNTTLSNFALAWKHIVDLFNAVGVPNVKWCFCVAGNSTGTASISQAYPGDAYVDYLGIDVYNQAATQKSMSSIVSPWYAVFYTTAAGSGGLLSTRPCIVPECGCVEYTAGGAVISNSSGGTPDGVTKPNWLATAFGTPSRDGGDFKASFPNIVIVMYSDFNGGTNSYYVDSSTQSQTTWNTINQLPYWQGKAGDADALLVMPSHLRALAEDITLTDTTVFTKAMQALFALFGR